MQLTGDVLSYTLRTQLQILQEQKIVISAGDTDVACSPTLIFQFLLRTMNRSAKDYRRNDRYCNSCKHLVGCFSLVKSMGAE